MKSKSGITGVLFSLLLTIIISGCTRHVVSQQPGPPPVVVAPAPPYRGAVWIASEWRWDPRSRIYVKAPGYWARPPRPQYHWIPGHWNRQRNGYVWIHGDWRR